MSGSSPLTRGKLVQAVLELVGEGLIPAHAGKTQILRSRRARLAAHPRSRGENGSRPGPVLLVGGSSPLTRGKRRGRLGGGRGVGLIPAHAGKTASIAMMMCPFRAHPRSRGENEPSRAIRSTAPGSSPLTRGKHVGHADSLAGGGLIPAHAGKTAGAYRRIRSGRAHPRSRGENDAYIRVGNALTGSSPLTRGKQMHEMTDELFQGLIPAHAGKTRARRFSRRRPRAHPRSRGENTYSNVEQDWISGSSPLTRGKRP